MAGLLDGTRVVELAHWIAGPTAAAVLADWGAEVIKIEPPAGDGLRGALVSAFPTKRGESENPFFEHVNRGKRSVCLDFHTEEGREIVLALLREADVLITNFRPRVLRRARLTYDDVAALNPRLVYCQITGYGPDHEESDRALVDVGVYARIGTAAMVTPPDSPDAPPPQEPNMMFDHTTGVAAAGAIVAALYARHRTGQGQRLAISLVRMGAFMMSWDLLRAARLGSRVRPVDREHVRNPLINCYRAKDGRWFWLLFAQPDPYWPLVCRITGRQDLLEDSRFADIYGRSQHAPELVRELDKAFAQKTLAEWAAIFDAEGVWWAPVNSPNEAVADPLVHKTGAFVDVPSGNGGTLRLLATPADFYGAEHGPKGPPPELGQHTEEVLLSLGYDWPQIVGLKERGVIP